MAMTSARRRACLPLPSEGANPRHTVMNANCNLIRIESVVINPVAGIAQQGRDLVPDFMVGNPNAEVLRSIYSRPFPSVVKHSFVKFANVGLCDRVLIS
jgi:hypothetical protein